MFEGSPCKRLLGAQGWKLWERTLGSPLQLRKIPNIDSWYRIKCILFMFLLAYMHDLSIKAF